MYNERKKIDTNWIFPLIVHLRRTRRSKWRKPPFKHESAGYNPLEKLQTVLHYLSSKCVQFECSLTGADWPHKGTCHCPVAEHCQEWAIDLTPISPPCTKWWWTAICPVTECGSEGKQAIRLRLVLGMATWKLTDTLQKIEWNTRRMCAYLIIISREMLSWCVWAFSSKLLERFRDRQTTNTNTCGWAVFLHVDFRFRDGHTDKTNTNTNTTSSAGWNLQIEATQGPEATQPYSTCVQAHSRSLRIHFTAEFAPFFHSREVNS